MDDVIKRRVAQRAVEANHRFSKRPREIEVVHLSGMLEIRGMLLRQDPGLEWKARRERTDDDEAVVLAHDPDAVLDLLPDDVAVDAALLVLVIFLRAHELVC